MQAAAEDLESPPTQPPQQQHAPNKNMVKMLTDKLLCMLAEEVNKPDTQKMIRQKIILPVINMLYTELYPYIIGMVCVIVVLLVLSILTFAGFIMYYLRNL